MQNKPKLFIGKEGSGKSYRVKKLLEETQEKYIEATFEEFQKLMDEGILIDKGTIVIDGVSLNRDLEYIMDISKLIPNKIIVTSQLNDRELESNILRNYDITQCKIPTMPAPSDSIVDQKKVLSTKTYTIIVTDYEDGTQSMQRTNDGFKPMELLGLTDFIALEIREQIMGRIKPDIIKREVIL